MDKMKMIWLLMCIAWGTGIFSQLALGELFREIRRGNSLTRQIKLKFASCKKLDIQVNNTEVFVEKLMDNYRVCGFSLTGLGNVVHIMAYVCILLGLLGVYMFRETPPEMLMIGGLAAACFCMLKVVACLVDAPEHMGRIKVELVDSLENYSKGDSDRLEEEMKTLEEEPVAQKHFTKEAGSEFQKMSKSFQKISARREKSEADEALIKEILEEYLT